ncbi:MAG: phosphoenolpyruvate--protein phosphotransferase [Spirochaetaceae bacterium]|jgi:phosphotransferase system enzyme I (PtsI)|nr:phosphoenolpyruvate--protein phosphotransferase [Spirochaetaceae bacterium]
MKILSGISAVAGVVIGKALLLPEDDYREIPRYTISPGEVTGELERFVPAVQEAAAELRNLKESAGDMNSEQGKIFEAHLLMLEDPDFHYQIKARLESKYENIEWIVFEVARDLSQKLLQSDDAYLRERAADVADVSRRIINCLRGINRISLKNLEEDVILVARNLLPSDALGMDKKRVKALVMDMGSRVSHTAILVRSFGIPSVIGLSSAVREISNGDTLIVDGEAGKVILDPDRAVLKQYETKYRQDEKNRANRRHLAEELSALQDLPAETSDGRRVVLKANIEIAEEAAELGRYGAEGIGLYRSEFLFLQNGQASEEQQLEAYSRVVKALEGRPVTIRTVDLGGDKLLPGMQAVKEENPLLGWRAIRFSLSLPDLFMTQLRAILRSSAEGTVKIMFPMISGIEELEMALALLEEAKKECRRKGQPFDEEIKVGTMIEMPAAVVTADILAERSDFFSIGTNDLIQYTLAVDRGNEKVSYLAQATHPAVIRFIKQVIDSAHARGIPAAMCGELAGDSAVAPLLLGMGLDEFSMTAQSIPRIKELIRSLDFASCKILAEESLTLSSCKEIQALVNRWLKERFLRPVTSDFIAGDTVEPSDENA